jgi:hypothetical protein
MKHITNIIKPSSLKKGKYQSKVTEDEPVEIPLKQTQPAPCSRWSFRLTKKDNSSRSITSLQSCELVLGDYELKSSISTFDFSDSTIFSEPHNYENQNEHIEDLKPRRPSRVVIDKEDPKPKSQQSCAVKDDESVQVRKPRRRMSFGIKRSPEPEAVPSTNVPTTKTNPRRSRAAHRTARLEKEEEVSFKIRSMSLCSKRVRRAPRSSPTTDSKASTTPPKATVQRSRSSRRITDYRANVVPEKTTRARSGSLDDCMAEYDEMMVEFPDASSVAPKKTTRARSGSLDNCVTEYEDMMVEFPDASSVAPKKTTRARSVSLDNCMTEYDNMMAEFPDASSVAPKETTRARSGSLDDCMAEYDDMMAEFPDEQKGADYGDAESVTGW